MTGRSGRTRRRGILLAASLLLAAVARAGTLEDMDLRSNVETGIRGTAATAHLHLRVTVTDGVAALEGRVRNLAQEDFVVDVASRVHGIRGVDRSGFLFEAGGVADEAVASAVSRVLLQVPTLASSEVKVESRSGVVTLTGTLQSGAFRKEIRDIAGTIDGVVDVVDRLVTPETPDAKIKRVLDLVFAPRTTPRFPGRVRVAVDDGTVVLEGSVPTLYDKRLAERHAWEINGVRVVDDRLKMSGSSAIKVVLP